MSRRRPRYPRILRSRRGPIATVAIALLLAIAVADRAGLFGWRGDDRARYHGRTFHVVNVVDGDTLDVGAPDGDRPTTRIRLWGVDTPETGRGGQLKMHFGPEASAYAKSLALNEPVRLELSGRDTRDRYGRLLAYVYLARNGTMLNERLLETGHAYADTRFEHEYMRRFKSLEERARKDRVGLWATATVNDMPHWRQRLENWKAVRSP